MMQWYFINSFVFLWVDHGMRRFAPRGPKGHCTCSGSM